VWPLKDYVAVNPYFGLANRSFLAARAYLRMFSDCETLMPMTFFAAQFRDGKFGVVDINRAISELRSAGFEIAENGWEIVDKLAGSPSEESAKEPGEFRHSDRRVRTYADLAAKRVAIDWSEAIRDEIGKYCAAHYDDGQASWRSPGRHLSLYQAWRSLAVYDRNLEILGLSGFCGLVAELPQNPEAAILYLLERMGCPQKLWTTFLLAQVFSIPGWCAWAKYQDAANGDAVSRELFGLIAMRLAYDWGVSQALAVKIDWSAFTTAGELAYRVPADCSTSDVMLRFVCLRSSEIAYRRGLLSNFAPQESSNQERKLAQMVFCIDVRSERIRRHLEAQTDSIDTIGFAGFFGMPIEVMEFGTNSGRAQLPVLLKAQVQVHEQVSRNVPAAGEAEELLDCNRIAARRSAIRSWRKQWRGFQTSAIGCFPFVEATGLWFGWKLLTRSLGWNAAEPDGRLDGIAECKHYQLGPSLAGLAEQGLTCAKQADWAEGMLRNMGLTDGFSRLVVFCGHKSQTDNNPLAASLDCGACGGHSGEPNARLAALLLNQPEIRSMLAERGIDVPGDTHFMAAVHNTTTDRIEFFDTDSVPATHRADLSNLQRAVSAAETLTRQERMPTANKSAYRAVLRKAMDWSEVRPEWGLAGNAAFVVAPRAWTKHANLEGRAFLHSYEATADRDGKVLELIMTAPMIVANWINMQYYASTVDNHHFGSDTKTVHNVVGRFGILSGNGGDLKTGLPWQSLHTGNSYQHIPLRLQVIIAAPRDAIDRILDKHDLVANLVLNGWLHLIAIDQGKSYRLTEKNNWHEVSAEV
jgi:uncharacterized protein YbcC (UPF0753/DUF2309 family)